MILKSKIYKSQDTLRLCCDAAINVYHAILHILLFEELYLMVDIF